MGERRTGQLLRSFFTFQEGGPPAQALFSLLARLGSGWKCNGMNPQSRASLTITETCMSSYRLQAANEAVFRRKSVKPSPSWVGARPAASRLGIKWVTGVLDGRHRKSRGFASIKRWSPRRPLPSLNHGGRKAQGCGGRRARHAPGDGSARDPSGSERGKARKSCWVSSGRGLGKGLCGVLFRS